MFRRFVMASRRPEASHILCSKFRLIRRFGYSNFEFVSFVTLHILIYFWWTAGHNSYFPPLDITWVLRNSTLCHLQPWHNMMLLINIKLWHNMVLSTTKFTFPQLNINGVKRKGREIALKFVNCVVFTCSSNSVYRICQNVEIHAFELHAVGFCP